MPHKDWGIGEEVLAVDFNPNVADQVVAQYASAAARAAAWATPPAGAVSHLNTTDEKNGIEVYSAVSSAWRKPWNIPWGCVGQASATIGTGSITTVAVDINGMTLSVPMINGRRYKTTLKCEMSSTVNNDTMNLQLTDAGGTVLDRFEAFCNVGTVAVTMAWAYVENCGATATVTRKGRGIRAGGTGILTVPGSTIAAIVCEDIGPVPGVAPS
jgi:hypothetical protein